MSSCGSNTGWFWGWAEMHDLQPTLLAGDPCRWRFPWPTGVNVNQCWRLNPRTGRLYLTTEAARWKKLIRDAVVESGQPIPDGPLALRCWLHPPRMRRFDKAAARWIEINRQQGGDVDGVLKLAMDAVFSAYSRDDASVAYVSAARLFADDPRPAGLYVELRAHEATDAEMPWKDG